MLGFRQAYKSLVTDLRDFEKNSASTAVLGYIEAGFSSGLEREVTKTPDFRRALEVIVKQLNKAGRLVVPGNHPTDGGWGAD